MRSRVKHEGLSFLTITLPTFGSDFEESLGLGYVAPHLFRSFRKRLNIPAFLQDMFGLVFDKDTGRIFDEPSLSAIEGIRQLAYTFKKLKIACSPSRVNRAIRSFSESEHKFDKDLVPEDISYFTSVRRVLWSRVFGPPFDGDLNNLLPKHGPGATAERITGNSKYRFATWYDRLEPYFPLDAYAMVSANAMESKEFKALQVISEEQEQPVRVVTVPKTLKAPRVIAIEPVCMQYTQQAVSSLLVKRLESHPLTRGHVNFTDQGINRRLAMKASLDKSNSTLDLSDASNLVPLSLAISMFESCPDIQGAILACRSRRAKLPTGEVISLKKFASMGSALCFPIEAMYFYTICIGALLAKRNLPVTYRNILTVSRHVYVYGDDIIVPTDSAEVVIDHLQKYYCKVNTTKSHWKGNFRESCGMDAFLGEEVTPTYVKYSFPDNRRSVQGFLSLVETSNLFYLKGYWTTAALIVSKVQRVFGKLPILGKDASGVGLVSFQHYVSVGRWNRKLQRHEVKAWRAAPVYHNDKLGGYPALLKCLLALEARSSSDATDVSKDHLNRTARYGAVTLKRRWISPV
jgi:hypothetical protein